MEADSREELVGHCDDSSVADDSGIVLYAQGFAGACGPHILDGKYVGSMRETHDGKPIFSLVKSDLDHNPASVSGASGGNQHSAASFFYCDESHGDHVCGWWLCPDNESDIAWAFNVGANDMPPVTGWRSPSYCKDIVEGARLVPMSSMGEPTLSEEQMVASVSCYVIPPDVHSHLQGIVEVFRAPPPLNYCIDCRKPLSAPCVAPCGHLVCAEHLQSAGYKCPWSPECETYPPLRNVGLHGVHGSGVMQQLLALVGDEVALKCGARGLKSSEFWEDTAGQAVGGVKGAKRGVCACDTPLRLAAAYEWLSHEHSLVHNYAEACVAIAAAAHVYKAFVGSMAVKYLDGNRRIHAVAPCRHEGVVRVAQWHDTAVMKANAWARKCNDREELVKAVAMLPTPSVDELKMQICSDRTLAAFIPHLSKMRQLLDCPLCYRLLHEPTTTPCGHTFCRNCLARALDATSGCAMCRSELRGYIGFYGPCLALQHLVESLWPEESAQRYNEEAVELREVHASDEHCIPLCTPGELLMPHETRIIRIFDQQQRLMLHRALESGSHRFGMCLPVSPDLDGRDSFADIGIEIEFRGVRIIEDGRAVVDGIGMRRFRVLDTNVRDGYTIANVEFCTDSNDDVEETREAIELFLQLVQEFCTRVPDSTAVAALLNTGVPSAEDIPACDQLAWQVLARIPAPLRLKYHCFSIFSYSKRFSIVAGVVRRCMMGLIAAQTAHESESQVRDATTFL